MSKQRRLEDREISVLVVEPGVDVSSPARAGDGGVADDVAAGAPLVVRYAIDPLDGTVTARRPHQPGWKFDASAFLLDVPTESEAILIVGPELRRIDRGAGGSELLTRAAAGAAAWRRERARALRRMQLPDRLLAFSEELNRAHSLQSVCATLVEHVGRVVGGYTGLVYLHENTGPGEEGLFLADHPWISHGLGGGSLSSDLRFIGPGLVRAGEVMPATGSPFANLAPVFRETSACAMAFVPLGDRGLLLLIERRESRVFEAEDWDLLRSVARQAEVALERVSLFERVHALSLTDPLTGLGNRRKMEIVLEHSFAAARRGTPLSVVMIDMDGFKEFNDTYGHVRGDEVLRRFGECLHEQVRGSDLVVRYGGDEFLFVLTGADAAAAAVTVERVRQSLKEPIPFSAGIAEYDPGIASSRDLIDRADRALYAGREQRASTTISA
jgi:diguanylate cyclase (GGDEF)-like protein